MTTLTFFHLDGSSCVTSGTWQVQFIYNVSISINYIIIDQGESKMGGGLEKKQNWDKLR